MAMFENTDFTGYNVAPDVVGYGDIHSAYLKSFRQRILFNVGSVGNPLDVTQASYAILEGTYDSRAEGPFAIQLVRVPYDIERAIQQAQEAQMPDLEPYIVELGAQAATVARRRLSLMVYPPNYCFFFSKIATLGGLGIRQQVFYDSLLPVFCPRAKNWQQKMVSTRSAEG